MKEIQTTGITQRAVTQCLDLQVTKVMSTREHVKYFLYLGTPPPLKSGLRLKKQYLQRFDPRVALGWPKRHPARHVSPRLMWHSPGSPSCAGFARDGVEAPPAVAFRFYPRPSA